MISFIIGVLVIIGSSIGIMHALFPTATSFTPGRRARGLARWWGRCTRWTNRLKAPSRSVRPLTGEPTITQRQMQQLGRAVAGVNDRPTPAEFAAAPLYGYTMVDRLLKGLDDAGGS